MHYFLGNVLSLSVSIGPQNQVLTTADLPLQCPLLWAAFCIYGTVRILLDQEICWLHCQVIRERLVIIDVYNAYYDRHNFPSSLASSLNLPYEIGTKDVQIVSTVIPDGNLVESYLCFEFMLIDHDTV